MARAGAKGQSAVPGVVTRSNCPVRIRSQPATTHASAYRSSSFSRGLRHGGRLGLVLTVEEAQARVLAEVSPLGSEDVALTEAHGRVLREDVRATADVPERDNSAMDGYAVRAEDIANAPGSLTVIGDLPAGPMPP